MKRPEKQYQVGETFVDVASPPDGEGAITLVIYTPDHVSGIPLTQKRLGQLLAELEIWNRVALGEDAFLSGGDNGWRDEVRALVAAKAACGSKTGFMVDVELSAPSAIR